jgi:hypothetical protein
MSRPLPIACTLSATDLRARGAELRALGGDGLVSSTREAGRAVLRFRPAPDIRERVEAIVAAESECCPFLDLRVEHRDDATVLTIAAPDGGAEVVELLAEAFSST